MDGQVDQRIAGWLETYAGPAADAAWLLCDRHAPDQVAMVFVDENLVTSELTYGELADRSRRVAASLRTRGVQAGDRVAVLLSKGPELVVTLLALWRLTAVHVPLFTAFAQGAIAARVRGSGARLLVTESAHYGKAKGIDDLELVDVDDVLKAVADIAPLDAPAEIGGDGAIIEIFTSGTTGAPKGVSVPLRALATIESYMHYSLDVREDDVYWNAADPGWAYGLYFSLLGPMATGHGSIMCTAPFSPELAATVIRKLGVTNFAGAPTMYRAMRASGMTSPLALRCASSAGEPLNADLVEFGRDMLGVEIRDHYGQTELAMVLANHWNPAVSRPVVPGSMGQPLPGFKLSVVNDQLAVSTTSSLLWFTGYTGDVEHSTNRFTSDGRWYLTGDLARQDEDGNFHFTSRSDDVILAAGYRIGPSDVESVLVTHPAVAEAAVVGRPDPEGVRGEQVEAFVVLTSGTAADDTLVQALQDHVRDTYSRHAYPRRVHFVATLPKTPSGKIQRFALRETPAADRAP